MQTAFSDPIGRDQHQTHTRIPDTVRTDGTYSGNTSDGDRHTDAALVDNHTRRS